MTLRYKRSRILAREIDETASKLEYQVGADSNTQEEMNSDPLRVRRQVVGPDGEIIARVRKVPLDQPSRQRQNLKHPEPVCNMKNCWCRQPDENKVERDREPIKSKPRVTWDQILSQEVNRDASPQRSRKNATSQVDGPRVTVSSRFVPTKDKQYNDRLDPIQFVEELSRESPGDLLNLKLEIDKAAKRMGLDEYFPREAPREKSRSRVVVDYLEDLTVEMLKKRLEESETRNRNMRQKLEDTLVAQKLEIQSLKSELYIKNEEVSNLRKNMENTDRPKRDSLKREIEFVQRVTSLDERLKSMMEKDEKTNEKLENYERLIAELKAELVETAKTRDLYKAKMEIYQSERDQAVASLSVYEKTFKNLRSELGQELQGLRPSLDLTADSQGTLDVTGRDFRGLATSSPNVSLRRAGVIEERNESRQNKSTRSKKRTKHTLVDSSAPDGTPSNHPNDNKENLSEALLQQLDVLGKEFKQFSENVLPLALGLENEAHQLLDVSSSTCLSWSDLKSQSSTISSHVENLLDGNKK